MRRLWVVAGLLATLVLSLTLALSVQAADTERSQAAPSSGRSPDTIIPITGPVLPGWTQLSPNGLLNAQNRAVFSIVSFGGKTYIGTDSSSGSQIWRKDSLVPGTADFYPIMVGGFNVLTSTSINQLYVFNNYIYAAVRNDLIGGELWRSPSGNIGTWERVASGGFDNPNHTEVYRLQSFNGNLYATTWWRGGTGGSDVWRSPSGDAGTWTKVITAGFGIDSNQVAFASEVYNGQLYLGFGRLNGRIYRSSTGDAGSWTEVAPVDFNGSYNYVTALTSFGNQCTTPTNTPNAGCNVLYAATSGSYYSDTVAITKTGGEVWQCQTCDGNDWNKVATNGFGNVQNRGGMALEPYHGRLFAAVANPDTGMEVWATANGTTWTKLAMLGFGDYNNWWTGFADNGVSVIDDRLLMGTFNQVTGGEIWEYLENSLYLPIIFKAETAPFKPAK